jgi:hypothetical protein
MNKQIMTDNEFKLFLHLIKKDIEIYNLNTQKYETVPVLDLYKNKDVKVDFRELLRNM